jgi:tetratricopeptide (TPR) repeat protein
VEEAVKHLRRASRAAPRDVAILGLLARALKRQGSYGEARATLRQIPEPDADVLLQLGLLSLQEQQLAQAEEEFAGAWRLDPASFEICRNLLFTRLSLGRFEACLEMLPAALELAERDKRPDLRLLTVLQSLLRVNAVEGDGRFDTVLADMSDADTDQLVKLFQTLGPLDVVLRLLKSLQSVNPSHAGVREACVEASLVKAKDLFERCDWTQTEILLRPLVRETGIGRTPRAIILNMLGCCSALTQDFDGAVANFNAALKWAINDPRVELRGDPEASDPHWNRFFDMLDDQTPAPADIENYAESLAFESLRRLADRWQEKEKWTSALGYAQRANRHRPEDAAVAEQLFRLYIHAKRPQDARRTLDALRRLRPDDPELELFECELVDRRSVGDVERLIADVERITKRHAGDARVEDRAATLMGDVVPLLATLCDRLIGQMSKVVDQVRHLPDHKINWSAVREVMRDLIKEFQKMRRLIGKVQPMIRGEELRRTLRDLSALVDRKMESCRSMTG